MLMDDDIAFAEFAQRSIEINQIIYRGQRKFVTTNNKKKKNLRVKKKINVI
jgi:hypothetical protein